MIEKSVISKLSKTLKSPVGTAKFPHLNKPDTFHSPEGKYKVDLVLSNSDAEDMKNEIESFKQEVLDSLADAGVSKYSGFSHTPLQKDSETGDILLRVKSNAKFRLSDGTVKDNSLLIFDENAERTDELVRHGSKIRVMFKLVPYIMAGKLGITGRLLKVQVQEFAKGAKKDSDLEFDSLVDSGMAASSDDSGLDF